MVANRCFATASWEEKLAFLTGRATMEQKDILPELWAQLLKHAAGLVPFTDLKDQTQSLRQILIPERHSERRRADSAGPTLWDTVEKAGFTKAIGFFPCSENVLMPEDYEKAPRKEPPAGSGGFGRPALADIWDSILVVPVFGLKSPQRDKIHFLRVNTIWTPQEREDDSRWPEFWYELSAITISDLDDAGLAEFAIRPHISGSNKAMQVLWYLERGMSSWRDGISAQMRHATKVMYALRGMYRNAGGIDLWG